MRFLVLALSLIAFAVSTPAPGRAEEPPPATADVPPPATTGVPPPATTDTPSPAETPAADAPPASPSTTDALPTATPSTGSAPPAAALEAPSAPVESAGPVLGPDGLPVLSAEDNPEVYLSDLWITRMTEQRRRRQRTERWLVPFLLGGAAALGAGTALVTPGLANAGRIAAAASAGVAAASMFPAILTRNPNNRGRWFVIGGGLFAMAYGASGFADSFAKRNKSCDGYCYDEKSVGWLGAAFFAQGLLLLPMALVERGPSLEDFAAYERLPANERPATARQLLARIDRDERKSAIVQLVVNAVGLGIMGAGAALVHDRSQRAILLGFAGFTLGADTIGTVTSLFKKSRLERLVTGESPDTIERVQW